MSTHILLYIYAYIYILYAYIVRWCQLFFIKKQRDPTSSIFSPKNGGESMETPKDLSRACEGILHRPGVYCACASCGWFTDHSLIMTNLIQWKKHSKKKVILFPHHENDQWIWMNMIRSLMHPQKQRTSFSRIEHLLLTLRLTFPQFLNDSSRWYMG